MPEIKIPWTPKQRPAYPSDIWATVQPGEAIRCKNENEANACQMFCRRRGWTVSREKQEDGTYLVGREK